MKSTYGLRPLLTVLALITPAGAGLSACSDGGGGSNSGTTESGDTDDDAVEAEAGRSGSATSNRGGESGEAAATLDDDVTSNDDATPDDDTPRSEAQAGASSSSEDGDDAPSEACELGELRCGCYPNGTCNAGLSCLSDLCVELAGSGGAGAASSSGGTPNESTSGGTSNETATGGMPNEAATGGTPNEAATGGTPNETATGGTPNEAATGGTPNEAAIGGTPNEAATGGTPNEAATGGTANEAAPGGTANETASGGVGNQADTGIIENFSTCDPYLPEIGGRSGEWYGFSDTGLNFTWAVSLPGTGWADQSCAAWAVAGCNVEDSCSYGGIGFELAAGNAYDLSGWSGLTVELESGDDVWLVVKTLDGGYFGAWLDATSGNATRNVGFGDLYTMDNSAVPLLDSTLVTEIQFTPASPEAFGFAIHLVALH